MGIGKRGSAAVLGGLLALAGLAALAAETGFFRIATGTTVGTYFPIGRVIASAITSPPGARACEDGGSCGVPGLIAVAHSTRGALENLQLIGRGQVESGFAQADLAAQAYRGVGPFVATGPLDRLRVIASLFPEAIHVVARRGGEAPAMTRIADLVGRRISVGLRESGAALRAEAVLQAYGIGLDEVIREYHEPAQAAERLRDGRLDAMFLIGGWPIPVISDLARGGIVDLLPIDGVGAERFLKANPAFRPVVVPAAAYKGIEDRQSVAVGALWLTSSDVGADLVHDITAALWRDGNRALLDGGHRMGRRIRRASALNDLPLPLHEGARRYYLERKMIN